MLAASQAQSVIRDLAAWRPLPIDMAILERAWLLQGSFSLSWWDALIVAAAQTSKCGVLLTEDLQHGQVFDTVRVIDPFKTPERTPAQIME